MTDLHKATDARDNSNETVDETTDLEAQEQEQSSDEGKENESPKSNFDKYKDSVKKKFDEKDLTIKWLKTTVQELQMNRDYDVAVAQYWEDAVANDEVLKLREEHPTLSYWDAIKLAWVTPVRSSWSSRFAGTPKIDWVPTQVTSKDLSEMSQEEYNKTDDLISSWKVKVVD